MIINYQLSSILSYYTCQYTNPRIKWTCGSGREALTKPCNLARALAWSWPFILAPCAFELYARYALSFACNVARPLKHQNRWPFVLPGDWRVQFVCQFVLSTSVSGQARPVWLLWSYSSQPDYMQAKCMILWAWTKLARLCATLPYWQFDFLIAC